MRRRDFGGVTFKQIEKLKGIKELPNNEFREYPLPAWYGAVRTKPLDKFSVEDLCKACRQNIYPEFVVPAALVRLKSRPLAGYLYNGELVVAMKGVRKSYWSQHIEEANLLKQIVHQSLGRFDPDVQEDAEELISTLIEIVEKTK